MKFSEKFYEQFEKVHRTVAGSSGNIFRVSPNLFKENLHGYSAKGCIFVALLVLSVNRLAEL